MIKEEKLIFKRVFLAVIFIFLISVFLFFYKHSFNKSLTGLSIKGTISEAYSQMPFHSKIFLIMQWIILILVLLYASVKDKDTKSKKNELEGINLKKLSKKQGTDLDTLYSLLKNKKQLRISTVSQLFKIRKEKAVEWCKILESGNLAFIDYSSARGPIIQISNKHQ